LLKDKNIYYTQKNNMTTCQAERVQQAVRFTLLPFHSKALGRIKDNRFGMSVLHPPTVMIRAVADQQLQQIETHRLTQRELDVLKLIVDGYNNLDIAQQLYITIGTVKTHVRSILNKLNVNDRTQAAVLALRSGLVD
jgi:DNA-binding NarL/FixJ family response regulator